METKKQTRRAAEPRIMYAVRVPVEVGKRVQLCAERWSIPPTAAAAKLISIGLDAEAETYDPNKQFEDIGFVLNEILNRLDQIDKLCNAAATVWPRSAIKSAIVLTSKLKVSSDAPEALRQLDAAVKQTIEGMLK